MKIAGVILLVLGALNLVIAIAASSSAASSDVVSSKIGAAVMLGVLGAFLLSRAKKRESDKKEKDEWNKNVEK